MWQLVLLKLVGTLLSLGLLHLCPQNQSTGSKFRGVQAQELTAQALFPQEMGLQIRGALGHHSCA